MPVKCSSLPTQRSTLLYLDKNLSQSTSIFPINPIPFTGPMLVAVQPAVRPADWQSHRQAGCGAARPISGVFPEWQSWCPCESPERFAPISAKTKQSSMFVAMIPGRLASRRPHCQAGRHQRSSATDSWKSADSRCWCLRDSPDQFTPSIMKRK